MYFQKGETSPPNPPWLCMCLLGQGFFLKTQFLTFNWLNSIYNPFKCKSNKYTRINMWLRDYVVERLHRYVVERLSTAETAWVQYHLGYVTRCLVNYWISSAYKKILYSQWVNCWSLSFNFPTPLSTWSPCPFYVLNFSSLTISPLGPLSRVNFFFFFRVTLVTIAITFHNPILILTLRASLLRFWISVYRQA